jgi:CheY-like chemotaxis protein
VLGGARASGPAPLLGAPSTNGRALVFGDQCQVCHGAAAAEALVECIAPVTRGDSMLPLRVCRSCEAWLGALASDGRSARGQSGRAIDGGYGEWLHPNLRGLSVHAVVSDCASRAAVERACAGMGVALGSGTASVLLVEAGGGRAERVIRADGTPRLARIVLAPLGGHAELLDALRAGATDWLTLPLTPQQLTSALVRAGRAHVAVREWDNETALPLLQPPPELPGMLTMRPAAGLSRFEVAWMVRRFARGYDELGVLEGEIVLVPRVPEAGLATVAERLANLLSGRCEVAVRPRLDEVHRRFEASY